VVLIEAAARLLSAGFSYPGRLDPPYPQPKTADDPAGIT